MRFKKDEKLTRSKLASSKKRSLQVGSSSSSTVSLKAREQLEHTHIIGGTGSGKSKVLEHLIRQNIDKRGEGFCLLDPHGSLSESIIDHVSTRRPHLAEKFIIFEPGKPSDFVCGMNPLKIDKDSEVSVITQSVLRAIAKASGQESFQQNPRIERIGHSVIESLATNSLTFLESIPFFDVAEKNNADLDAILSNVKNPTIHNEYRLLRAQPPARRAQEMEGFQNRLRRVLSTQTMKYIVGQQERNIDFSEIIESGKILIVNLRPSDSFSLDNSKLLGILIINELVRVGLRRNDRNPQLKPFHVYIDEFAQYISDDIAISLDQTRKYKLFMTLAHQTLAQLKEEDEKLYYSVLGNCNNRIVFGGLSHHDAKLIENEIFTGFHNLKSIKHEQRRIRERHIEETRTVRTRNHADSVSESQSNTESSSWSDTESSSHALGRSKTDNWSKTEGESRSTTQQRSQSDSVGISRGHSDSFTEGVSEAEGRSSGTIHADTKGRADTSGRSHTDGQAETQGHSHSEGQNESQSFGTGRSSQQGQSRTDSWNESHSDNRSHSMESDNDRYGRTDGSSRGGSYQYNSSTSESSNESRTSGTSSQDTESSSQTQSQSDTRSESQTLNSSETDSRSESINNSRSKSQNRGHSDSETHSNTRTKGRSESEGYTQTSSRSEGGSIGENETHTTGQSHQKGGSTGATTGQSRGSMDGWSESEVPFHRVEEVEEVVGQTFWSLSELQQVK